jgi:hypothetical protein
MAKLNNPQLANLVLFGGPFDGRVHEMARIDLDYYYSRNRIIVFPVPPDIDFLRGYRGATDEAPKPGMLKTAEYRVNPVRRNYDNPHDLPIFYFGEYLG